MLELLVSVSLLAVIMLLATTIFTLVLEGQRNTIASQNVQESMRYALEVMSKEIRMAKDNPGTCLGPAGTYVPVNTVFNSPGAGVLYFVNKDGACTTYELSGGRLLITRDAIAGYLTPSKITLSNLAFAIYEGAGTQPKVTVKMDARMNIGKIQNQANIKLQTTLSSRFYQ